MTKNSSLVNSRSFKALQGVVLLVLAWFMFLRAVDTGSLQQYGLLLVLLAVSIHRLFRAVVPKQS